jgi:hypothetical protein
MDTPASAPAGIVPLISGSQTGPLGIVHLPRFWFKMRAHAAGLLAEGYRHGNGGTDEALLTAIGVDGDAFAAHIAADAPDYPACETWLREHATNLTPETIRAFNEQTVLFEMPDPRLAEWTARFGLSDGTYTSAVRLNQLDDWDLAHAQLLASDGAAVPTVPAIGSGVSGPLGAQHLPRLWLKHRLYGAGRLAEGYRHGVGGFDAIVSEMLGFDGAAFATYVETERPDYLTAEKWLRANASKRSAEDIAALNERLNTAKMPAQRLAECRAELGAVAGELELGIPLNDLDDWAGLHRQLIAVAR